MRDGVRFELATIDDSLRGDGVGDAFQRLVSTLLADEHEQLHRHPTAGRDGGIDLVATHAGGTRTIVEAKHVSGSWTQVKREWRRVAGTLDRGLMPPFGALHRTWSDRTRTIVGYTFVTSGTVPSEQARVDLEDEMSAFFAAVGSRPGLEHLASLRVAVIDWSDLTDRLERRPHVLFRWFPATRSGFLPLGALRPTGGFHGFLHTSKLPFYGRAAHREQVPTSGRDVVDEHDLARLVERGPGAIVYGRGGHGKSRLVLETGRRLEAAGWNVLVAPRGLDRRTIDKLTARLTPGTRTLVLVDYIETQAGFAECVDVMETFEESSQIVLRYLANCRTSFYRSVAAVGHHHAVPLAGPVGADWENGYRRAVVTHILKHVGLAASPDQLAVCGDVPVLAAFMAFLHDAGRDDDLNELLADSDFGRWVMGRIAPVVSAQTVREAEWALAAVVASCPIDGSTRDAMAADGNTAAVLAALAEDGWILPSVTGTWELLHDVIADQILLKVLQNAAGIEPDVVRHVLRSGAAAGTSSTAVVALGRLAERPELVGIPWTSLFGDLVQDEDGIDRALWLVLVDSPLLKPDEVLRLLAKHHRRWQISGALAFRIARLLRRAQDLTADERRRVASWLVPPGDQAADGYIVTTGLREAPDLFRACARKTIRAEARRPGGHFPIVAWLEAGYEPADVRRSTKRWLYHHAMRPEASFLYRRWLGTDGDISTVAKPIRRWLTAHGAAPDAQFVYSSWLDAGGDLDAVAEHVPRWLARHGHTTSAQFVFSSWLDAGGGVEDVAGHVETWLARHGRDQSAQFVYKSWLDATADVEGVRPHVSSWLDAHAAEPSTHFLYKAWLDARGARGFVADGMDAWWALHRDTFSAQFTYSSWLEAGGDVAVVAPHVASWLEHHGSDLAAGHVYGPWLAAGGDVGTVTPHIESWLPTHGAEPSAAFVYRYWLAAGGSIDTVRSSLLAWFRHNGDSLDAQFTYRAWLDAGGGIEAVRSDVESWLDHHRDALEAQYVYKGWLDSGGDLATVRVGIEGWLAIHAHLPEAEFVLRPALHALVRAEKAAGGRNPAAPKPMILKAAEEWFHRHHLLDEAAFLSKTLAKDPGRSPEIVRDILAWIRAHPENPDAVWRLGQVLEHGVPGDLGTPLVRALEATFDAQVFAEIPEMAPAWLPISVLSRACDLPCLRWSPATNELDDLMARWLPSPAGIDAGFSRWPAEPAFANRIVSTFISGRLLIGEHRATAAELVAWLDRWPAEKAADMRGARSYLRTQLAIPSA